MGFRRKMEHGSGSMRLENALDVRCRANVDLLESVAGVALDRSKIAKIGRIGQGVDIDDARTAIADEMAHDRRPDEAGATCYQDHMAAQIVTHEGPGSWDKENNPAVPQAGDRLGLLRRARPARGR